MASGELLGAYFKRLEEYAAPQWAGRVTKAIGQLIESEGPCASVGEGCGIQLPDGTVSAGEIIGFRGKTVLSMTLDRPQGLHYGDRIVSRGYRPSVPVGEGLLGRVVDGAGKPIDGKPAYRVQDHWPLGSEAPLPLERAPIRDALGCGIRAIDGLATCGQGQRIGIFGGSGVGKSTLIGMMARGTSAELTVVALVGERGREVREFLEDALGEEGLRRSVVVVSTSDQSPLLRIRAAMTATAVAEYFCSVGKHVLLVLDSVTRFAMAQREIGLAMGEPPTAKGYTPSVFSNLARLIERAGRFEKGSITAFYSVLMEGDDQQDPLVDALRALLDGHLVLDRKLAVQGHYPPISVVDSLSRLMPSVTSAEHLAKANLLRQLLSAYASSEDLIRIGAYQKGADRTLDQAVAALPAIKSYLRQASHERAPLAQNVTELLALKA